MYTGPLKCLPRYPAVLTLNSGSWGPDGLATGGSLRADSFLHDDSSPNKVTEPMNMIMRTNFRSVVRISRLGNRCGARNALNATASEWIGKDAERGSVATG